MRHGAIFMPGIVTTAEFAFGDLHETLGRNDPIVLRKLAICDSDIPAR